MKMELRLFLLLLLTATQQRIAAQGEDRPSRTTDALVAYTTQARQIAKKKGLFSFLSKNKLNALTEKVKAAAKEKGDHALVKEIEAAHAHLAKSYSSARIAAEVIALATLSAAALGGGVVLAKKHIEGGGNQPPAEEQVIAPGEAVSADGIFKPQETTPRTVEDLTVAPRSAPTVKRTGPIAELIQEVEADLKDNSAKYGLNQMQSDDKKPSPEAIPESVQRRRAAEKPQQQKRSDAKKPLSSAFQNFKEKDLTKKNLSDAYQKAQS